MQINAVFEGGGVKGISLAGAVKAAENAGVEFSRVAGTSSGSIIASVLAAGYRADEIKDIIEETPFHSFLQRAPIFNTKFIGPALRVLIKKGLYSGEALENWIRDILLAKGIFTFSDIPAGKLYIVASDITNGRLLVLPDDLRQYGINPQTFPVAKAVRMSCSIPYFLIRSFFAYWAGLLRANPWQISLSTLWMEGCLAISRCGSLTVIPKGA